MNSAFKEYLTSSTTKDKKGKLIIISGMSGAGQIDSIQRYYEAGRDLSGEKIGKYMEKANKYIGKFSRKEEIYTKE